MLSDRRPFEGDGLLEIMKSIIDSVPPPLHALRPDLPRELGDLVMAMLARDPGLRPTAKEALLMLRQVEVRGERSALGLD
jgi:serine/threonine protein kinase